MNQKLTGYLFETNAIRVCPKNKPFWYTSGKIGPYYINTHFLYGSEKKASVLLADIDRLKEDRFSCSGEILRLTGVNYSLDKIYKGTVDALLSYIKNSFGIDSFDYISGGERRDWIFSLVLADILKKPHITLFKDLSAVIYSEGESFPAYDLGKASVLHIADLITTASSYERAWVPAVRKLNGELKRSLVVVDRLQGGAQVLNNLGIESHSLVSINRSVFQDAYRSGYINQSQLKLVLDYMDDPENSMKEFLRNNPGFIKESLSRGGRDAERAQLLIRSNFYDVRSFSDTEEY